jgi:hypothetical protein
VKKTITTRNLQRLMTASTIVMALQCSALVAQTGLGDLVKVPPVPSNLQPPPGHKPFLKGFAVGTQNYICMPSGWTFLGPQATLFVTFKWINGEVRQQIATHFLSPNPAEDGAARATWQSSLDTSAVWARAIANSTDPKYVAPGAIAWLLLAVVGAQNGPTGGSMLSRTTFIQRVNTSGGVAPTTACDVGNTAFVPYTTDYIFYKADE